MVCFGFKGGIGTSSRIVTTPIGQYTVGVLVQCNFGLQPDLRIAGAAVGQELSKRYAPCTATPAKSDKLRACEARPDDKPGDGSMIVVIATDAPLLPHQLKRLAKRPGHAMGRLGDISRESSGDIFMAFSTANPQLNSMQMEQISVQTYPNPLMNPLFEGVVQATEEAVLNAMVGAKTMTGRDGHRVYGLPHDEVRAIVSRNGARPQ
jgi:L-aminopeptidase/D-esterase-like protein